MSVLIRNYCNPSFTMDRMPWSVLDQVIIIIFEISLYKREEKIMTGVKNIIF